MSDKYKSDGTWDPLMAIASINSRSDEEVTRFIYFNALNIFLPVSNRQKPSLYLKFNIEFQKTCTQLFSSIKQLLFAKKVIETHK